MAIEPRAEHFPHSAEIGVRGIGRNYSEAFAQAAIALSARASEGKERANVVFSLPSTRILHARPRGLPTTIAAMR